MDTETKRILEENLAVTKETNVLLKKIISAQRWGRALHFLYWAVIIGASVGAYYWLQPVLGAVLSNYNSVMSSIDKVQKTTQSLPDTSSINSILDSLRQKQ
ncbi:MAG: hypothetical protein WC835_03455 [Candidatus Paceibacterota bacterium]|jgi:hypothetical protein